MSGALSGVGGFRPHFDPSLPREPEAPTVSAPSVRSPLLAGSPELLSGAADASIRFGARGEGVRALQAALVQLGALAGQADGIFGRGTERALAQFQRAHGLSPDGVLGPRTLAALDAALASRPGPQSMANAARAIVEKHAEHYGVDDPWFNVDNRHALPAGRELGGIRGKWKCNLFACNTMVAAGFEPPYYGNRGRGEYPNANQLFKWSDRYAAQYGNRGHERFELRGELDPQALQGADRERAIADLLAKAEPGDMIIVDHMGSDVADGGHCRVVVKNDLASGGTLECAQASHDRALVREETVHSFTGEERIWILRPNKPRPEGPANV